MKRHNVNLNALWKHPLLVSFMSKMSSTEVTYLTRMLLIVIAMIKVFADVDTATTFNDSLNNSLND
ncbi:hypothetical protein H6F77_11625 [Microcoleus sp. FACHB-831]|uniref:hypothetical protein n=1 Tax=Microcoleus sp. FACHB-831 TaxID=2692827 RepID=UPI00168A082A|nr:hypothetical protein [Microcoleus sp. FACHB-831]MBD1921741.1 hypothetical protein [Microcoleus sp. FACHB-831]